MSAYTGGSGPQDVARLRRMVAEADDTGGYTDAILTAAIERYPVADPEDVYPDEAGWFPTYDLAQAAAEVWSEKATMVAANFDFNADGAQFQKSQQYEHYMLQARKWRSLRVPGTWTVMPVANSGATFGAQGAPATASWVGNINNPYEYGL